MNRFIIPSKEGQEKLMQFLIQHNLVLPCKPCLTSIIEPNVHKLDAVAMRNLQNTEFYDEKVQEGIRCSINSIINPSSGGISGAERFFHIFDKMKKIGEGINGVAMSAGKSQRGKNVNVLPLFDESYFSRHGNFSDFDDEGLVIAKFSKDNDQEIFREFIIGQKLNALRNVIPNFSQVYGIIGCDAVYSDNFFCSASGNKTVLIMEKIKGVEFETWLEKAEDTVDNQIQLLSIFFQVIHSLWLSYEILGFTHNDLHGNNLIIREFAQDVYIPYIYENDSPIFLRTNIIPTFIDYGYSRLILEIPKVILDKLFISYSPADIYSNDITNAVPMVSVAIGTREFDEYKTDTGSFKSSYGPQQNSPIFDLFRFVTTLYDEVLLKPKLKEVFDSVMNQFPSNYRIHSREDILIWTERYFSLSRNDLDEFAFRGITIQNILKKLSDDFSRLYPTRLLFVETKANLNLIDRKVPVLACSETLLEQFYSHPLLSQHLNDINISCENSLSHVLHKLGIEKGEPETTDLALLYDYIKLTDTKFIKGQEYYELERAISQAENQVNQFNNENVMKEFSMVQIYASNGKMNDEWMTFVENFYKHKNIAIENLIILWDLLQRGFIPLEKEIIYINLLEKLKYIDNSLKKISEDVLLNVSDEDLKERAQRLFNSLD